jgi:ABC-type branched-subunit amino acid transport system substrate-binding protein
MGRKIGSLALVGVLIVFFVGLNVAHGADVKEVVVGEICAMTGPTSATHLMCMSGSKDYFDYVNETGGIKGKKGTVKIDYISYDSQYVAAKAKDGFARLREKGMIVLTHCAAGHSDALLADHERAKIPLVTGSLGVASMWSEWVYANYHPGIANMIRTWALWVKSKWEKEGKPGGKLILGAIESDEPWAPLALWDIKSFNKEQGIEIVIDKMPKGTTDATPQLTRLKKAGAREIFVLSSAPGTAIILKSAKSMGLDIPLTQCAATTLGDVIDLAGADLAEGYQGSYFYEPVSKDPKFKDSEGMKLAKMLWEKNHPGKKPRDMYVNGLLSGMIIVEAIKLALDEVPPDQLNGETLKKYGLDRIRDFDAMGLTTPISYIPGDLDSHIGQRHVWYWVVRNGYVEPLTDWMATTTYRIPKKRK